MKRHDVRTRKQIVKRNKLGIFVFKRSIRMVVKHQHLHPETFCNADNVAPDVAGADNAQGLAEQIKSLKGGGFETSLLAHLMERFKNPPRKREHERKCKLGDRMRAIPRHIAHDNSLLLCVRNIYMVKTG